MHPSCGTANFKMCSGDRMTLRSSRILFLYAEDNFALKKIIWLPCINKKLKLILKKNFFGGTEDSTKAAFRFYSKSVW